MIYFVSVPSAGVFTKVNGVWTTNPLFLKTLADLHEMYPTDHFMSPSIQNYAILNDMKGSGPTYDYWQDQCRAFVKACDRMIVVCAPGWETSKGVADEIAFAQSLGKQILYVSMHVI